MDPRQVRRLAERSANFGFLKDHPLLVYVDAQSAMFKARAFGDVLARDLVRRTQVTPVKDSFFHQVRVYDFRTNQHFTLKRNPLRREHLQDFVDCYLPGKDRSERAATERFKAFGCDELIARDKVNLDITWLKDASLEDADALLPPEVIAQEIVEDLQAALREFAAIAEALGARTSGVDDE